MILRLPPGFYVVPTLSTLHQWFTYVRLHDPYLTGSRPAFSLTLTTRTLNPCSLRWFGACPCRPAPRGPPSSQMQHRDSQCSGSRVLGTQSSAKRTKVLGPRRRGCTSAANHSSRT